MDENVDKPVSVSFWRLMIFFERIRVFSSVLNRFSTLSARRNLCSKTPNLGLHNPYEDMALKATIVMQASIDEDPHTGYRHEFINALKQRFTEIVTFAQVKADPELSKRVVGALTRPGLADYIQDENATKYFPNLKCIVNYGVGCDHLKIALLNSRGIKVGNTPGVVADCTADMAFLLMLASARNFPEALEIGMSPNTTFFSGNYVAHDVCYATLGIVGMGDIGFRIAKRAHAFCMKINYHNRNQRPADVEKAVGATYFPVLNEMLAECDFVILSCTMTPETTHIMSTEQFRAMKKTGTVINVGRGKLVDQDALVEALNTGEIGKAALDVTHPEPLPRDHPLLKCPNIIILPHHGLRTISGFVRLSCDEFLQLYRVE